MDKLYIAFARFPDGTIKRQRLIAKNRKHAIEQMTVLHEIDGMVITYGAFRQEFEETIIVVNCALEKQEDAMIEKEFKIGDGITLSYYDTEMVYVPCSVIWVSDSLHELVMQTDDVIYDKTESGYRYRPNSVNRLIHLIKTEKADGTFYWKDKHLPDNEFKVFYRPGRYYTG